MNYSMAALKTEGEFLPEKSPVFLACRGFGGNSESIPRAAKESLCLVSSS